MTLGHKHKTSIHKIFKKYGNPLKIKTSLDPKYKKHITLENFRVGDLREKGKKC
jgi:hypothetical protein